MMKKQVINKILSKPVAFLESLLEFFGSCVLKFKP